MVIHTQKMGNYAIWKNNEAMVHSICPYKHCVKKIKMVSVEKLIRAFIFHIFTDSIVDPDWTPKTISLGAPSQKQNIVGPTRYPSLTDFKTLIMYLTYIY